MSAGIGASTTNFRGGLPPRAVVVTRPTEFESLLARHGTREQARFFLASRGQTLAEVEARHACQQRAMHTVLRAIPTGWRRASVARADLDRFLFEPEDVVIAVGQDGLVANVAKYLNGQVTVGVNPSRAFFDGILVRHAPEAVARLLPVAALASPPVETRTMVEATTTDGQRIVALNEVFIGHRSHQSARYIIAFGGAHERHSSSGILVTTGTGATGWATSVCRARLTSIELPKPSAPDVAFLVREAFPSATTQVRLTEGVIGPGQSLEVTSEMGADGVVFGDGIEDDRIDFGFGERITARAAETSLRLLAA